MLAIYLKVMIISCTFRLAFFHSPSSVQWFRGHGSKWSQRWGCVMLSAIDSDTPRTWLLFNFTVVGSITHDGRTRKTNDPPPSANTCKQVVRLLSWGPFSAFAAATHSTSPADSLNYWLCNSHSCVQWFWRRLMNCIGARRSLVATLMNIIKYNCLHVKRHRDLLVSMLMMELGYQFDESQACSVCKGHKLPVQVIYCQQPIVDRHDCS